MLNFNPKERLDIHNLELKIKNIEKLENDKYSLEKMINKKIESKE